MLSHQKFLTPASIVTQCKVVITGKHYFLSQSCAFDIFATTPPLTLCTNVRLKQKWIFVTDMNNIMFRPWPGLNILEVKYHCLTFMY